MTNKPLSEKKMKEYELFTKDKKVFYWGEDIAQAIKDLKRDTWEYFGDEPAYELFLNKIDKIMGEFKDE